jgi:hypothetical protein
LRDLGIRQPLGHQREHLVLARRQAVRVVSGPAARPAWDLHGAQAAQPGRSDGTVWLLATKATIDLGACGQNLPTRTPVVPR